MTHALKAWADWYVSCAGGHIPHEAQAAYDAIDEIARLQAELERLRIIADGKWKCIERAEDVRIHNAAIEAAAGAVRQKINWHVSQADWSTSKADHITHLEKANALKDGLSAIRALKRQ